MQRTKTTRKNKPGKSPYRDWLDRGRAVQEAVDQLTSAFALRLEQAGRAVEDPRGWIRSCRRWTEGHWYGPGTRAHRDAPRADRRDAAVPRAARARGSKRAGVRK